MALEMFVLNVRLSENALSFLACPGVVILLWINGDTACRLYLFIRRTPTTSRNAGQDPIYATDH